MSSRDSRDARGGRGEDSPLRSGREREDKGAAYGQDYGRAEEGRRTREQGREADRDRRDKRARRYGEDQDTDWRESRSDRDGGGDSGLDHAFDDNADRARIGRAVPSGVDGGYGGEAGQYGGIYSGQGSKPGSVRERNDDRGGRSERRRS